MLHVNKDGKHWFYRGYRLELKANLYYVLGYSYVLKTVGICGAFTTLKRAKLVVDALGRNDGGVF